MTVVSIYHLEYRHYYQKIHVSTAASVQYAGVDAAEANYFRKITQLSCPPFVGFWREGRTTCRYLEFSIMYN